MHGVPFLSRARNAVLGSLSPESPASVLLSPPPRVAGRVFGTPPSAAASPALPDAGALIGELDAALERLHQLRGASAELHRVDAAAVAIGARSSPPRFPTPPPLPPAPLLSPAGSLALSRLKERMRGLDDIQASLTASSSHLTAATLELAASRTAAASTAQMRLPPPPAPALPPLARPAQRTPPPPPRSPPSSEGWAAAPSSLPHRLALTPQPTPHASTPPPPAFEGTLPGAALSASALGATSQRSPLRSWAPPPPSPPRAPASPWAPSPPPCAPTAALADAHAAERSAEALYEAAAAWRTSLPPLPTGGALLARVAARAQGGSPGAGRGSTLVTHALSLGGGGAAAEAEGGGGGGGGGGALAGGLMPALCAAAGLEPHQAHALLPRVKELAAAAVAASSLRTFAGGVCDALAVKLLGLAEVRGGGGGGGVAYVPYAKLRAAEGAAAGPAFVAMSTAQVLLEAALDELAALRKLHAAQTRAS
jgi:hypothetical protein